MHRIQYIEHDVQNTMHIHTMLKIQCKEYMLKKGWIGYDAYNANDV
jgi:hypothetical protein